MSTVVVFDAKPYDREYLSRAAGADRLEWRFHEFRLGADAVAAAHGAQVACVFVNKREAP